MTEAVDATIVVPVLNERAVIEETAAAMRAQRFDGRLEILFVDGRSDDGTREVLERIAREDPRVRVLDNPARRTPAALNVGLRAARGEYVARMDAHAWYPPDYVARGVDRLRRGGADWVAGPAIPRGDGRWSRRVALALGSPLGRGGSSKWRHAGEAGAGDGEVELDTGVFAGVWRRATLERLGGWDEDWPVNQDSEMAARVLAGGGRIVCLRAMGAEYAPRDTLGGLWRQYWRFGWYRAKTARRHPHSLRRSHLLPVGLVLALACAALPGRRAAAPPRAALCAYAGVVVWSSAQAPRPASGRDLAALPLVFATMHLAWGTGFLAACARLGPPLAALARTAGLR